MSALVDFPEVADRLGPDVADALADWAGLNDRTVRLLLPFWLPPGQGHTGAVLAALEVAPPPRVVILKVLPQGAHRREPGIHTRALRLSPPGFAAGHLVEQAFAPHPSKNGGALMFQGVAGGGLREAVPLSALEGQQFADTCEAVTRGVLTEWNTAAKAPERGRSSAFLRQELHSGGTGTGELEAWRRRAGLSGAHEPWFDAGDRHLPNPYFLVEGHPELPDPEVSILSGLTHGDLHLDNIVVPVRRGVAAGDTYRLIDLGAFRAEGPLSCDVAMLLLSALEPVVREPLPQVQRQALLDHVVDPRPEHAERLPPDAVRRVDCVVETAADVMAQWQEPWRDQLLLSVVAGALTFTTFSGLTPESRDWYVLLAAHAGGALLASRGYAGSGSARPSPPAAPGSGAAPAFPPVRVRTAQGPTSAAGSGAGRRRSLVEALEGLPAITDPGSREAVLRHLPRQLATSIPRSAVLRVEVLGLVDTCLVFPDGLRALWEAIRTVDTGTGQLDAVFAVLQEMPEF